MERKDRWKEQTIGRNLQDDCDEILKISKKSFMRREEEKKLLSMHQEVYDQLSKAASIGKIYQKILLEHMTKAELAERLRSEMMIVDVKEGA